MFPEFVLYWLSGRRVAEYTNASHTGLVNLKTGTWDAELFEMLGLAVEAAPPMVSTGTVLGPMTGPLAALEAFRATQIIAPATHDTASAIAGIPTDLSSAAYISSGTWSLVGTITHDAGDYAARIRRGVHEYWRGGRRAAVSLAHQQHVGAEAVHGCVGGSRGGPGRLRILVQKAAACNAATGVLDMDAPTLMLDTEMPQRINSELTRLGFDAIPDVAGNEPMFARTIFESLALRYASALANLEKMLGRKLDRIHMIGGATRNKLLIELTEQQTGLKVEIGETESSTVGSLAIQLAASEAGGPARDAWGYAPSGRRCCARSSGAEPFIFFKARSRMDSAFLLSHPFRKEREMDGARRVVRGGGVAPRLPLDFVAGFVLVCLYTGKEVDPAYEAKILRVVSLREVTEA